MFFAGMYEASILKLGRELSGRKLRKVNVQLPVCKKLNAPLLTLGQLSPSAPKDSTLLLVPLPLVPLRESLWSGILLFLVTP